MSPVIGYGSDHELAQYVYDLWLWTALGGAKNAAKVNMRVALASKSFSPEYWKTYHFGLIDLQRQLRYPSLFLTVSPFEWSTPYHVWVEDEMRRTLRSKQYLPGAETYDLAHKLTQVIVGMVTGTNQNQHGQPDRMWTRHVLGPKDGSGRITVVTQFTRLEFQDGKRKRGAQNMRQWYHGSGRPHVHSLVWLEHEAAIDLPSVVEASVPDENEALERIVLASQQSWTGSGWPVHNEPSTWDDEAKVLRLQHLAGDARKGIRAFMPDVIGAVKSHMDVQTSDGRGMLLRYVASYVPKFSDAFATQWLNDQASDYAISRRVLTEYHPMEPEMWMQLGGKYHAQCITDGSIKRFVVPVPWRDELPSIVQHYVASPWRRADMTLLEFMRKSNREGKIHRHILEKFERLKRMKEARGESSDDLSRKEFANNLPCRGEVMVAAVCNSRFNDAFYGQWLLLHKPFADVDALWRPSADLVPEGYRMYALCLLHDSAFWRNADRVRQDMELEAYKDPVIESNLAMLRAHADIIDDYLSGNLVKDQDPVPPRHLHTRFGGTLSDEQPAIADLIVKRWRRAVDLAWPAEYDEDMQRPQDAEDNRPLALLGPAGSGKSFLMKVVMTDAMEQGARVILVCPTRMLVADYRMKVPGLDVDSIHSAFQVFRPEAQTLDSMTHFDLIVIEEVGQVSSELFERLLRLWAAAARRPALVFLGDFMQLRGVEGTRACDSPIWSTVRVLELRHMRRCKCDELKWKLELLRTAKPSQRQLGKILKGHKAPRREHRTSAYMTERPTEDDIMWVFAEKPTTTFVTISRAGAAWVNDVALQHFFQGRAPIMTVNADPESNPANFWGSRQIAYAPKALPIHIGMRVMLTKNINKDIDYVNGMEATVTGVYRSGVRVKTRSGYTVVVYPWTDEWRNTYLPMRLAYANTLLKMQGATLEHLTIYLDVPGVEAAGYVALSRVQHDRDWQFVGDPTTHHFTPSTGW